MTTNQALKLDQYPLPKPDRGPICNSCNLYLSDSQVYLQLPPDEPSNKHMTMTTHRGLYQYNQLLFSIASAPAACNQVFQHLEDFILDSILVVIC